MHQFYTLNSLLTSDQVPVKEKPDHESPTISAVTKKDLVEILWNPEKAWSRIRVFADKYEWYVLTWQLQPCDIDEIKPQTAFQMPDFASEMQDIVNKYWNIPYLRWWRSYEWIDCSWLVQRIYWDYGVQLPRDSSQQAVVSFATTVDSLGDALPWDLVFFHNEWKTNISHVWILVDQNHIFHAWQYNWYAKVDMVDSRGIVHHTGEIHNHLSTIKRIINL